MNPPDARTIAWKTVFNVLEKGQTLDDALEKTFQKESGLDTRDKAFIKNLVTTLFRRLPALDKELKARLKKPLRKRALWVRSWLLIGATQILFMEVPDHAAVDTVVSGIAKSRKPGAKSLRGLANALLRGMARDRTKILKTLEDSPEKNLPPWLWDRWKKQFGEKTARDMALAQLQVPPLDLTLKRKGEKETLGPHIKGEEIFPGVIRLSSAGQIENLPGYREGLWWPQDVAASLPPRFLGNVDGKKVLDLCAAPGGKTLFLATRGAKVTAVDISGKRLKLVRENLHRLDLKAQLVESDAREFKAPEGFDFILLDAPCSATGTLRRHPDVAAHRKESDIRRLAKLQKQLLIHAFSLLAQNGVLVYCVCSLEREEGEDLIKGFLKAESSARRIPLLPEDVDGHKTWITGDGDLRTLPCHLLKKGGMDGFYAARIRRI